MTREELDFICSMNMCDEISNEAYKKIVCHCEEQKPCDDCISRKDMLAVLRQSHSLTQAWDGFEKLPSVTPKEKTGKWQIIEGLGYYTCSVCKCDSDVNSSYCPKCGAKMEGEELVEFDEEVSE